MHHDDWLEAAPIVLTGDQWASLGPEQRRLRHLQNLTRVHYLHSQHQQVYGRPELRLVGLDNEVTTWAREHPAHGQRRWSP